METINIKGKEYITVNERLKFFRENFKDHSLISEIVKLDAEWCVIRATVFDETERALATGIAYEKADSTYINKTSYVENCETSAWGRALGNLGIGIDVNVASADEVANAINNQDKPEKKQSDGKMSEKQWKWIVSLGKSNEMTTKEITGFVDYIAAREKVDNRHWKIGKVLLPEDNFNEELAKYMDLASG